MNIKRLTHEGRDTLVVPMVMIREGTWAGSNGPIHYPGSVLQNSVPLWNGKPIVIYHPLMNGRPVNAQSPKIFDQQRVGTVFHTRYEGDKLKAEAWLEEQRLKTVDSRVATKLLAYNRPVEVSTGVGVEIGGTTPNGVKVASCLQPDHLAILPDRRGACSLADGAGLMQNAYVESALPVPSTIELPTINWRQGTK